jgi:ATP-dependent helicase Lhr and Lhr-like helicase
VSDFERLQPSIQHHIVNSLGWSTLRPLQEAAIAPILDGDHGLLLAPTAGGKTEAVIFPMLSRISVEGWQPLSTLYLCPLRALLNNLLPRLERYASYTGHRIGLWHGDVGDTERHRLVADPPDVLLTTPESLEAMLMSTRVDASSFFARVRAVIIDEVHAFASDDRGWHLLAVLARLEHIASTELQRIGLSATVGNPPELLEWLTPGATCRRHVVDPPAAAGRQADVEIDHVGTLDNAATVISRLHRGEKRLVFIDSRDGAERLTHALRERGTTAFVTHASLGRDERRRAESAFADGSDCVIVATSALELGIDVGDLDRVIQINAPATVASFLQRLGRSGRRAATTSNMLFLTTDDDALWRAWSHTALGTGQGRAGGLAGVASPPRRAPVAGAGAPGRCRGAQRVARVARPTLRTGRGCRPVR